MIVFQIGFNKCGTSSIWYRLDALGFQAAHLKIGDGQYLAAIMNGNLKANRHILTGLEDYDAFTDMEYLDKIGFIEGYKFYPQILEQVPDSYFILNMRNREHWIDSRLEHNDGAYAEQFMNLHELPSREALAEGWRHNWDHHVDAVRSTIPPHRLLVLDIDQEDISKIDRFTGRKPVKPISVVPQNFTRSLLSIILSRMLPSAVKDGLPSELSRSVHYILRRRR